MLLDTHCRLDHHRDRLPDVLAELRRRRVFTFAVSDDQDAYARTRAATAHEPLVLVGPGLHPRQASVWPERLDGFVALLDDAPFLGDVGLARGGANGSADDAAQMAVFDRLLAAARSRSTAST